MININNNNNNIFDEKYSELTRMLTHKYLSPPDVTYIPPFTIYKNGNHFVIYKLKTDLHGIGILFERFTYNFTTNILLHYHIRYDNKTLRLVRKFQNKKNKKQKKNTKKRENVKL